MSTENHHKAIFVSSRIFLGKGGGGVQWCTREYIDTIHAAGIATTLVSYDAPQDLPTRLIRKIFPSPYRGLHAPGLIQEILRAADLDGSHLIFLNNTDAAALAPVLRAARPHLKLIFLSHGVELTDVVNNLRIAPETLPACQRKSRWIGDLLKTEIGIRNSLDGVTCISQEDVAFEQWLGSKQVLFLPRQIPMEPLAHAPIKGRVGTVATLNHGPNLHGIRLLAEAIPSNSHLEIRLVGGPESIGLALKSEFRAIKYLGRLSDEELKNEASTWCAFVNPIFCHARGASTKVATALGWGLPVLTTPSGARGYSWNQEIIPLADSPKQLVDQCIKIISNDDSGEFLRKANLLAGLAPGVAESSRMLSHFINSCLL